MTLVREYIDRYRGDEMEDIFKLLEDRLIQVVKEYVQRKAIKDKEWLRPDKWIQKILQDNELGKETKDFWVQALLNHGYHKLVKESLDFERGLDPHKVLNLGIKEQILKYAQLKCHLGDWSWSSPSGWIWEIQEDKDIPPDTKLVWYEYLQANPEYLKISMDEHGNVSEAVNFERGLAPKQAMGIGLEQKIDQFLENSGVSESGYLSELLQNPTHYMGEGLSEEEYTSWIQYMVQNKKYTGNLDENDYYELQRRKISWIPFIPLPNENIQYEFKGERYFLKFTGWEEFADYFDTDARDISKEFIEAVLTGDGAEEYFRYDFENFRDIQEIVWYLKKLQEKKQIPALKELKERFLKEGGDPEKAENLDDLFEEIDTDDAFEDLHDAISRAWIDSQEMADQDEAFKDLKKAIKRHYNIGDGEWHDIPHKSPKGDWKESYYYAPTNKEGVEKLSYTMMVNDSDYKIKYYPPQYSYNGDITADTFNDSLSMRLDDV